MSNLAPQTVYRACLRGLKRHDRAAKYTPNTGATAAALSFAEIVSNGFPIDAATAVEILEAHRLLDEMPRHPDGESEPQIVSRLLWGGDDAPEWAEAIVAGERQAQLEQLEPEPAVSSSLLTLDEVRAIGAAEIAADPVLAEKAAAYEASRPDVVAAESSMAEARRAVAQLADDLFAIDERVAAELRAAFWVAYRAALRAASAAARFESSRVSRADRVAAGIDTETLTAAQEQIRAAGRYDGYQAIPDNVAAVISPDLERALSAALDDYEEVAAGILRRARLGARRRIADRLGVGQGDIEDLVASDESIDVASSTLRVALLEWVRARLDGDREPEDLDQLQVPEDALAVAIRTTAGATADDDEAESIGASLATRVLDRISRGLLISSIAGLAASVIRPEWRWDYGDPSTRATEPFPPHFRIRNQTWRNPEERLQKIGTARPKGDANGGNCQCRIVRNWRLTAPV